MRIVHAADIHLDTPYVRHEDSLRRRLQDAGRESFSRLVELTLDEKADALLIAGDLFDNEWLTIATERVLTDELHRLTESNVTVVYVTGNHDPGRANYRAAQIDWPGQGFHIISGRQPIEIPIERNGQTIGWVVGAGHQTPRDTENLAAGFPIAPSSEPAVALLHAHVAGTQTAPEHEPYAPAALADFRGKGYAYWALGHIHRRQSVLDDPLAAYSGNLQGRSFKEAGAKGALVVDISANTATTVRFAPLARVRWETLELDELAEADSISDIKAIARSAFSELAESSDDVLPDQEWILRFELRGRCPMVETLRREDERADLAEYLRDALDVLDIEVLDGGLHRLLELSDHRGQQHVLSVALDLLDQARNNEEVLRRIKPEVLANSDAFGSDEEMLNYLRGFIEGMDEAVAEALLRDTRP